MSSHLSDSTRTWRKQTRRKAARNQQTRRMKKLLRSAQRCVFLLHELFCPFVSGLHRVVHVEVEIGVCSRTD